MRIVVCGKGGQGVMTLNYTIGYLASKLGYNALSSENHGLSVRGGSINSFLNINNSHSSSIASGTADLILSTDYSEIINNIHYLSENGIIITNGVENIDKISSEIYIIDAKNIAYNKFGNYFYANSILLGKMIHKFKNIFNIDNSINILKNYEKINYEALLYGINL